MFFSRGEIDNRLIVKQIFRRRSATKCVNNYRHHNSHLCIQSLRSVRTRACCPCERVIGRHRTRVVREISSKWNRRSRNHPKSGLLDSSVIENRAFTLSRSNNNYPVLNKKKKKSSTCLFRRAKCTF